MLETIFGHWKTTLAAVVMVVLTGLKATGTIDVNTYNTVVAIAAALGLAAAADGGNVK